MASFLRIYTAHRFNCQIRPWTPLIPSTTLEDYVYSQSIRLILSPIPDVGGMINEPPMRWVCIVIVDVPEEEV